MWGVESLALGAEAASWNAPVAGGASASSKNGIPEGRTTPSMLDFEGRPLAELGYRMPAEWKPHTATWLTWPHKPDTWPGNFAPVPGVYARFVRVLADSEEVHILVRDHEIEAAARRVLREEKADAPNVFFHTIPNDDVWIRDCGPVFVRNPEAATPLVAVNWEYNSWGGKYPPYDADNAIPAAVAGYVGCPVVSGNMVLEGGSIDVDGEGLLLTTEQCLLHPNRNPSLSREQIEQRLRDLLGVRKVLWLGDGIEGDDTDGHIDDLTRFVAPGRVVTVMEEDETDLNHAVLRANRERLRGLTGLSGHPLDVVDLPMPEPVTYGGQRLPASYANFYIANNTVVVPVFGQSRRNDEALGILRECFPGRKVVGIEASELVLGLGAFHCISQQQPAV